MSQPGSLPRAERTGALPESKGEHIRRLSDQGLDTKQIARLVYDDPSERGRAKVRAIRSKLRKEAKEGGTLNSSRGADAGHPNPGLPAVVSSQPPAHAQSQPTATSTATKQQLSPLQYDEVVRAPVAGLSSRVGYLLERDVVTVVLCSQVATAAVKKLAERVTGAGFYVIHQDGVAFQAKGDTVSISEPNGDTSIAAEALRKLLTAVGTDMATIEKVLPTVKHPGQISFEELTVDITDKPMIETIRRCEPFIPDPGRGPYVILAPSPLMPGLKIYMKSANQLRIELVAHSEKQAFNGFYIRGELVGDVLPRILTSPGTFDKWRAQYWHPYSHPIVINLGLGELVRHPAREKAGQPRKVKLPYALLSQEVRGSLDVLRDLGCVYFNDFRVILSESLKKSYRGNPSRVMQDMEFLKPHQKRMFLIILRKVAVDYQTLAEELADGDRQ